MSTTSRCSWTFRRSSRLPSEDARRPIRERPGSKRDRACRKPGRSFAWSNDAVVRYEPLAAFAKANQAIER
jgi:hypothetical protein